MLHFYCPVYLDLFTLLDILVFLLDSVIMRICLDRLLDLNDLFNVVWIILSLSAVLNILTVMSGRRPYDNLDRERVVSAKDSVLRV